MELKFFYMIFLVVETNLVFFICNNFMNVKHGFENFKCAKNFYCILVIKFEHFNHDIFLVMHNHLIIS
jgi:hypothetical protein